MSSQTGPATLYIIRHGEKLGDPSSDSDGGKDLSVRGSARAAALPSLFAPAADEISCGLKSVNGGYTAQYSGSCVTGPNPRFSTPNFLFATKNSNSSDRPVETITPLASALSLTYDASCSQKTGDMQTLVTTITTGAEYTGKVILICWHHGTIPNLAQLFGIKKPPTWEGTVFDRVWELTFSHGSVSLLDQPQQLLFGDSDA